MKDNIIDQILSSTGYLPPRNEKEMNAFERIYSKVEVDEAFHVDVGRIVNESCQYKDGCQDKTRLVPMASTGKFTQNDLRMAARNFGNLPEDVIEKLKKQHKDDGD